MLAYNNINILLHLAVIMHIYITNNQQVSLSDIVTEYEDKCGQEYFVFLPIEKKKKKEKVKLC